MPKFNHHASKKGHAGRLSAAFERMSSVLARVVRRLGTDAWRLGAGAGRFGVAGGMADHPAVERPDAQNQDAEDTTAWQDMAIHEVLRHAVTLGPLVKRREYLQFKGLPRGLRLGWAQMNETDGRVFSLGVFCDDGRFSQLALADDRGRVFIGAEPTMDTHDLEPCLIFGKEGTVRIPRAPRMARPDAREEQGLTGLMRALRIEGHEDNKPVDTMQGGIVGRDDAGQMMWLASWLKRGNRYTLEQLRADLPSFMRRDLEYRDAVAVAFFAAYLLPRTQDLLIGFGSGNIFRRLNREAPIGAIRRSVRDTFQAGANGMRTSGLEEYFADLMREAGALEPISGLEAVHGAEPLHLYTSTYSGGYFLTWDSSLEFSPALSALKIEGNLNRFADVSVLLERNARMGALPIEDTVTRAEAAQIDFALLQDPALIAFRSDTASVVDPLHDDGKAAVLQMMRTAREAAASIAAQHGDPTSAETTTNDSPWVYRQTMATLLCNMRLPYRFDVEFRSNLGRRNAAIAFTTAGMSMMPTSRYDSNTHSWQRVDDEERARMSAWYNLRVGLMMAAISFGAGESIDEVSLHIDSIGLEEAVAKQDSAIAALMGRAFAAFDRMRNPDAGIGSSKADPKDGDIHGDPSKTSATIDDTSRGQHGHGVASESSQGANDSQESQDTNPTGRIDKSGDTDRSGDGEQPDHVERPRRAGQSDHHGQPDELGRSDGRAQSGGIRSADRDAAADAGAVAGAQAPDYPSVDQQFNDLMKGVDFPDIDEVTFSTPDGISNTGDSTGNSNSDHGVGDTAAERAIGAMNTDGSSDGNDGAGTGGNAGSAGADADDDGEADSLNALSNNPTVRHMVTVSFSREAFVQRLHEDGLSHPIDTYRLFRAAMDVNADGALMPVNAEFNLRDARFSPVGAQEEPEFSDVTFRPGAARILGARRARDLSIQRVDLLQRAVSDFHVIAAERHTPSVDKAQRAMEIVDELGDPELSELSSQVSKALIDGGDTPELDFPMAHRLDAARLKARDLLFSGQVDQAITLVEAAIAQLDQRFADVSGVPRYFNSYAERVIYNRLFATPGERTVLIPDNLFYAHMELSDALAQLKGAKAALPHLNAMVAYAPAYPLSHMKLAIQLARDEDWDSARAACLNALHVSLDRDDAAFAYYRFAYASWMRDELDVAAAAYMMSDHIASGQIAALDGELRELIARAQSQCVRIPTNVEEAQSVLQEHNLPVWPHTDAARIVRDAARVCVDNGMFVPARTLSVAAARMNDSDNGGIDIVQAQFLRSLNT